MSKIVSYKKEGPEGNWELFYGWEKILGQVPLSVTNSRCIHFERYTLKYVYLYKRRRQYNYLSAFYINLGFCDDRMSKREPEM